MILYLAVVNFCADIIIIIQEADAILFKSLPSSQL